MLSAEYGKITGWWNKKNITGIDLWDIVEVCIFRDNNKNTIKQLEPICSWWNKEWEYTQIHNFLETLNLANKITIDGSDSVHLYNDLVFLIEYGNKKQLSIEHFTIFQMRILKNLWSMNPEMFQDDPILTYIYEHISHSPLERILSASNIKFDQIEKIKKINLHSIYLLQQ